jgi:hypothetical protein
MSEDDRSHDDPHRHSPSATVGLNARLQSLLLAALPTAGVPAALHVDQDASMEGGELFPLLSGAGVSGGPGGVVEGSGEGAVGFLRTSPFTVISTPSNAGSLFEAFDGGKANRGYEVDEGFRDEVTSRLQALQARRARGSPAEEEGGLLGGGQPPRHGPARRGTGRQGPVAFVDELDEFGTPQGAERSFYYAPDMSERLSREEATYPLFRFHGREESDICGGIILSHEGGPSKFCIDRNCPFAHVNKAGASLTPGGSYVQFSDKHALFNPMLPLEAAEHDSGSAWVLTKSFTQEVWASVFRQLVDN